MLAGARISVVIPAHNEARLIERTVRSIPGFVDDVLVVDDGSTDQTPELARRAGAQVLVLPDNRGVGAAIEAGYRRALALGSDIVAVMAGDGQMDPDDLSEIVLPIVHREADYVKGNRLAHPEVRRSMPALRFIGNRVFSFLTRKVTGLDLDDSQCGYTAIRRECLPRVLSSKMWPGYGYPNDLLGTMARLGLRVRDVPVRAVYGDEESGIGLRHALLVIPFILARIVTRRMRARVAISIADRVESP
jgi:glycosyltransferase involved in cell wall biosynthesis